MRYRPQLVAITGSSARGVVAESVRLALQADRTVRVTPADAETPLAVAAGILGVEKMHTPRQWMTLLGRSLAREVFDDEPDALVVPVGATRPGDVDRVAMRMVPHVAVVTNAGTSHTRLLGERSLVAHEYESLVAGAGPETVTVLNSDDELVMQMAERAKGPVMLVGRGDEADVRIVRTHRLGTGGLAVELNVHGQQQELSFPRIIAQHHIPPIAMGFAVAHALGVTRKQALAGIRTMESQPSRMELVDGINGTLVIDDTYDATPESMLSGLSTLRSLKAARKIAVLGDVTDLGGETQGMHQQMGVVAAEVADIIVVVGREVQATGATAMRAGIDVHHFASSGEVGKWLPEMLRERDLVYVSGSKPMQMHEVVERLLPPRVEL